MITLQLTGPNNGNRTLAPNTSKIVNKNTILDFYTFLSNLKVLKCNMHFNLEQIVEKYTCMGNWLSGAADWARQARHVHGFHTGPLCAANLRLCFRKCQKQGFT